MTGQEHDMPIGIRIMQKITNRLWPDFRLQRRQMWYRISVWVLTFIAYMCYHMSRKPISVVKAVLHQDCSQALQSELMIGADSNSSNWCDWAPFDGSNESASRLLGLIDSAFLFAYAFTMFFSGALGDRVNLRYFLTLGMLFTGVFSYLFGIAKTFNIHSFTYFFAVQVGAGIAQTTGWPAVVSILGNWCGKKKRGLTFGIWNSHTSIGNILGSLIAAEYVERNWALSFIYPGLIIGVAGFLMFLFLVVSPHDVGCADLPPEATSINSRISSDDMTVNVEDDESEDIQRRTNERSHLIQKSGPVKPHRAIGLLEACKIPGVMEFSLSLFFAKLVSYTFLYWLPLYVQNSTSKSASYSADVSTLFDVGGIIGAIAAGLISDHTGMSATTCAAMLFLAIPAMFIYQVFGNINMMFELGMLIVVGIMVNGPYALITTAVSAELGTHHSLDESSKALATVTAIIDGTGSIGAAVGPLIAGFIKNYGWKDVFYMLMFSNVLALCLLGRLVKHEIIRYRRRPRAE